MRFGISRSPSPSSIRRGNTRGRSGYGLGVYDSSDEDEGHDQEFLDDDSSSSSSPFYVSESKVPPRTLMRRSAQEQREIDETVLSFRRRGDYEEPFKTWAKETRTAAFRVASTRYENNPGSVAATQRREIEMRNKHAKETYDRQYKEVTAILEQMNFRRKQQEMKLIADYKERERLLWQRVEGVIKDEEDRLRRKHEAEDNAKREMEQQKRREEERRKAEEEKWKKEEQEKALKEELLRKRKEKEEEEARQNMEEERRKRTEMDKIVKMRKDAGFSTAQDDWGFARQSLELVKQGHVPSVKRDPTLRSVWSKGRRSIVPKIGQLTNSQLEIQRIASAILQVFHVQPSHTEPLHFALLSALAKAILMQAETEVSARAVTAIPLAQVTVRLLTGLELFADVLFARMVQRTGGWVIPIPVAKSPEITEIEYKKLRGYRTEREEQKNFENRVQGIMTLYFAILTADVPQPMSRMWAFPRYWTYLARLMSTPILLRSDIAMQIVAIALEVGGARAKRAWGTQFLKLLDLLYKSVRETSEGGALESQSVTELAGASGVEGRPARVKVILEIEKVMST